MKLMKLVLVILISISTSMAADLKGLTKLFEENFNVYYQPRYCGRNVARLINEATKRNINLSNSFVVKFVGNGFLETSGFYTRSTPNERVNLGYFHMVLIADGHVFDFDLYEPIVLRLEDYIRLQFAPPSEPFYIWGIDYRAKSQLASWDVTRFETSDYARNREVAIWTKKMSQFISLDDVLSRQRVR